MRILFSAVPALGHVLPFAALARAARAQGHEVALLTNGGLADPIAQELPGVHHLPAGPSGPEFVADVERRTGRNPLAGEISVDLEAYMFGDVRVELAIEESLDTARAWGPDVIIADDFDGVGPLVATAIGVPWCQHGVSVGLLPQQAAAMESATARHYADRGLVREPALVYLDRCPETLQGPDPAVRASRLALRPEPHTRPGVESPARPRDGRPRVLVTFGTVFNHPDLLRGALAQLDREALDVVATVGGGAAVPDDDGVRYVGFEPLGSLLRDTDVVLSVGGAGTVLAALARGIPMVLVPQGADQPSNAERAGRAGAAMVLTSFADVGAGIAEVLADPSYRQNAQAIEKEIASMPSADDVLVSLSARIQ